MEGLASWDLAIWAALALAWGALAWRYIIYPLLRCYWARRPRGGLLVVKNGRIIDSHVTKGAFSSVRYFQGNSSASISPDAAYLQIDRIAQERRLDANELRKMVEVHVKNGSLNTLFLNLDLDRLTEAQIRGKYERKPAQNN